MRKKLLLGKLAISCAVLASGCASGVKLTVCLVDSAHSGFQCVYNGDTAHGYLLPFEKGTDLLCASPGDTEEFLKNCKNHVILPITLCSYKSEEFQCSDQLKLSLSAADNFVCLSQIDHTRLLERCK